MFGKRGNEGFGKSGTAGQMVHATASIGALRSILRAQDPLTLEAYVSRQLYAGIDPVTTSIGHLVDLQIDTARDEYKLAEAAQRTSLIWMGLAGAMGACVLIFALWTTTQRVTRPLLAMTQVMRRLAGGDHQIEVPAADRNDETGQMAQAVLTFKHAAVEKAKSFDVDKVVAASRTGIELPTAPEGYVKLDPNHHLWSKSRIAMGMPDGTFKVVAESPELIKPDPFPKGYQ